MSTPKDIGPRVTVAREVTLRALDQLPLLQPGDDLVRILAQSIDATGLGLGDGDILVVASKLLSRVEGRFVDLSTIEPGPQAHELAAVVDKEARLVELILSESSAVSRAAPGVLIVRHKLGHVSANAGLDRSNATPHWAEPGSGPWILLLPADPDASAEGLRQRLQEIYGVKLGVIISDSLGRPFRHGTVGHALGVAGVPALSDQRGQLDLHGRPLEYTYMATGDQVAAAADMVMGQSGEGRGAVLVRGLAFEAGSHSSAELRRPAERDLYA